MEHGAIDFDIAVAEWSSAGRERAGWHYRPTAHLRWLAKSDRVPQAVYRVRTAIAGYLLGGALALTEEAQSADDLKAIARETQPLDWLLALSVNSYSRVYLTTRVIASAFTRYVTTRHDLLSQLITLLDSDERGTRIMNWAIASYFHSAKWRVRYGESTLPSNAFFVESRRSLVVNAADYARWNPAAALSSRQELFDPHDLAHVVAVSLNSNRFGAAHLRLRHASTVRGNGSLADSELAASGRYSSGFVFTAVSKQFYLSLLPLNLPTRELIKRIQLQLEAYFLGLNSAIDGTRHTRGQAEPAVTPVELAALAVVQMYELPGAEVEQLLLTRGSHQIEHDPLRSYRGADRLLAASHVRAPKDRAHVVRRRALFQAVAATARTLLCNPLPSADRTLLVYLLNCMTGNGVRCSDLSQAIDRRAQSWIRPAFQAIGPLS